MREFVVALSLPLPTFLHSHPCKSSTPSMMLDEVPVLLSQADFSSVDQLPFCPLLTIPCYLLLLHWFLLWTMESLL